MPTRYSLLTRADVLCDNYEFDVASPGWWNW